MTEPAKQKIIIVDENDEIIGHEERGAFKKKNIYRVSALWITNSRGEILLAKRHHSKAHHPGMWGPAVAGTVEKGETYLDNIIKEAEEELGLKNIKPELGPKTKIDGSYHFTQWFMLTIDKKADEFVLQEDEVEAVAWISPEELRKHAQERPEEFVSNMKKYIESLLP
ncbi:MAG: NUDIX domain-containing protein [Parcubacteria group bacterium]|jgi:isopentenyldiphosphate isomerase